MIREFLISGLALLFSSDSHAIINGIAVPPGDPIARSTVGFITDTAQDHWDPSYCTGSIIDVDLIVTAAHCIKDFSREQWRIVFSRDARPNSATRAEVTDYAVPSEYDPGYAGHAPIPKDNFDIALLYFKSGLPSGYHPAEVLPGSHVFQVSDTVITAGYGLFKRPDPNHPYDPWNWGVLREAGFRIGDPNYARTEIQIMETSNQYGAKGDSGGPAFVAAEGRMYLFGATDWGNYDPYFEVYADVRAHLAWISGAAARLRAEHP